MICIHIINPKKLRSGFSITWFHGKPRSKQIQKILYVTCLKVLHKGTLCHQLYFSYTLLSYTWLNIKSLSYLGVIIDDKLNFKAQIEKIRNNVNDKLNMLKILLAPKIGCHPQSARNIYKSIIESYILYGISAIGNSSETGIKRLNTAINKRCRKITGCSKTTSINT